MMAGCESVVAAGMMAGWMVRLRGMMRLKAVGRWILVWKAVVLGLEVEEEEPSTAPSPAPK